MKDRQKGIKALNPLTILYMIIALAVISAIFDYRVTLVAVVVIMVIAVLADEGKAFIKLWLKSIFLICVICFVLQSLFIPGEQVIWKLWIFSVKVESVNKAIGLCSRILGIGSAILLGGKLIDIKKLMVVLEKEEYHRLLLMCYFRQPILFRRWRRKWMRFWKHRNQEELKQTVTCW